MELNDIRIFIELYRNKSISKTADKLCYTQSNISTRLMKLEKEFNTVFFIRTKSGLEILPAGERFMDYAMQIDRITSNLYHEFRSRKRDVNIASTQLLSRLYFPLLYQSNNSFHLYTSPLKKLARGLENKTYDIVITHTRIDFEKEILSHTKSEPLSWAQAKKSRHNTDVNPSVIVSRDRDCPLRNATFKYLASISAGMPVIEVDTLDLMLSLLRSVDSIALLPQKLINNDNELTEYTAFDAESLLVYFYCYNTDEYMLIKELF